MATEPATPATPLAALEVELTAHEVVDGKTALLARRRELREKKLEEELRKLDARHQEERRALSQELRELAVGRKAVRDQLWEDWISSPIPGLGPGLHNLTPEQQQKLSAELPRADRFVHVLKQHLDAGEKEQALDSRLATSRSSSQQEDGASSSAAASNGEKPGEEDEENPCWAETVSQQRVKEKEALLKELLPAKNEVHVEVQRLLEVLEEKELRKAYEHRITKEDSREVTKAHQLEDTAEGHIAYVDSQLGCPKLPGCYEEIKKLWDIEKNPIFSTALQEWNRKEELFSRRVERKKNRVASLKNEVYQLFGFFSVFQGVVLTAVAQSSLLYCHNYWIPIALSVLASVISTVGVYQKLNQINYLQRNVDSEERAFATAVKVGQRLRKGGPKGIDFVELNAEIESTANRQSKKNHLGWSFVLVILTLVAFGFLFAFSFWKILCKPAKMGKTTLTNNVGFNVQVKEGNANIFRNLQVLKEGKSMTIEADSAATYREYVLVLLPDNKPLRQLNSDDIQELPAIEIFNNKETGEVDWRELQGGSEKKSWFGAALGWFFPKSGAKAHPKADAKAESSKSTSAT